MEMDAFDNDRNRSLDFREFSKLVREREMAIHTEEALRKRFKAMDADGSGEIEMAEFIKYALKDALQRSSARVVDLLREWDEDGSGEIEKGEFVKVVRHLGFDALESEVNAVFDELDFNQSGSLEIRELKQKLNEVVREEAAEGDKDYGVLQRHAVRQTEWRDGAQDAEEKIAAKVGCHAPTRPSAPLASGAGPWPPASPRSDALLLVPLSPEPARPRPASHGGRSRLSRRSRRQRATRWPRTPRRWRSNYVPR